MDYLGRLPGLLRSSLLNCGGFVLRHRRFSRGFHQWMEFLSESQFWSREKLLEYQVAQIRQRLHDAEDNVPFYGRHFAACEFRAREFSSLEDLHRIEPVTKQMLLDAGESCLHRNARRTKSVRSRTSGTTGQKFAFWLPFDLRYPLKFATIWRHYSWAGINLFDRRVTMGGRFFAARPPFTCVNRAENQLLLSIHHLSDEVLNSYISAICDYQPVFMQGHPSGIATLARRMLDQQKFYRMKAVFTTGETLTQSDRRDIEQAFQCSVLEEYGCGECVFAAQQAPGSTGFHEVSELGLIQFLESPISTHSTVVATSLHNNVMPFIRYHVEDLVEVAEDSDYRTSAGQLPVKIKTILGRIDENLIALNGSVVLPVSVRMCIKPFLPIGVLYQVRQEGPNEVTVCLEKAIAPGRFSKIEEQLKRLLGQEMTVKQLRLDEIRTSRGKIRNVINCWKNN